MKIAIIDYGMGNLKNVKKAFEAIDLNAEIINRPEDLRRAERIVLPGVGAFRDAILELNQTGFSEAIRQQVKQGKPLLGICLGMQLLFNKSYEHGEYTGLGLLEGSIVRFKSEDMIQADGTSLKVPHMGWNTLDIIKEEPLFRSIPSGSSVYFVHSYYLETTANVVSAYTDYGTSVAVAAQKENIFATQFHPEKSGTVGLQILKNFGGI